MGTERLFIGGPWHATVHDVGPLHRYVRVPNPGKTERWHHFELPSTSEYELRRFVVEGAVLEAMVDCETSESEALERLKGFLATRLWAERKIADEQARRIAALEEELAAFKQYTR